jgi:hypothetical protein
MGTRKLTTFRFPKYFKTALAKVAKAQGMSQAEFLEAVFWSYHDQVEKLSESDRRKLDTEARAYLEGIKRGNKE